MAKKKRKEASEVTLDTSDLRPCRSIFSLKDEESFAGEYIRFSHIASNSILEEDKGREEPRFSVYSDDSGLGAVKAVNDFFWELSGRICKNMHQYLLEHDGKVVRWAVPEKEWTLSFKNDSYEFCYDYFALPYVCEDGRITRSSKRIFQNYYYYPERDPNLLVKNLEKKFYDEHSRSEFLREESKACEIAKSELQRAKEKDEVITGAKVRLILVFLLILLAGLATAYGFGLSLDLVAAANALTGFFSNVWSKLPVVLNFIVCALLAIPLYAVVMALMFTNGVGTILLAAGQLGTVWLTVFLVVLWGAVLVASVFMGVHCAFWKSPLPDAQKEFDRAKDALNKKRAEYERMEEEFRATESYQRAKEKDKQETEADQLKKAENERFAECWQRAWFEAVKDQQ